MPAETAGTGDIDAVFLVDVAGCSLGLVTTEFVRAGKEDLQSGKTVGAPPLRVSRDLARWGQWSTVHELLHHTVT